MPVNANVIIAYGPYNLNGIIEYKTERIEGLQKYLQDKGHKVIELREEKLWNNMEVIVNNESVFKCKLDQLEFGGDGQLDPLVIEAEKLVQKAY